MAKDDKNTGFVNHIAIDGLFDVHNYGIDIYDDKLVIVGENGKGKSTILQILYSVLTSNWSLIRFLQFSCIRIRLLEREFVVLREELDKVYPCFDNFSVEISKGIDYYLVNSDKIPTSRKEIKRLTNYFNREHSLPIEKVTRYLEDIYVFDSKRSSVLIELEEYIRSNISADFIRFSTSRSLHNWIGIDISSREKLKISSQNPLKYIHKASRLANTSNRPGLDRLLFLLNDCLSDKIVIYDEVLEQLSIFMTSNDDSAISEDILQTRRRIPFEGLSSGEKQILLILSLSLLSRSPVYIMLDEPEISMSISWQKKVLQSIVDSQFCRGLFVATQSPFVFDNTLDGSAKYLDESNE